MARGTECIGGEHCFAQSMCPVFPVGVTGGKVMWYSVTPIPQIGIPHCDDKWKGMWLSERGGVAWKPTTERNPLWWPGSILAADPASRSEELEPSVAGVLGDPARRHPVPRATLAELDWTVGRGTGEPARRQTWKIKKVVADTAKSLESTTTLAWANPTQPIPKTNDRIR